MIDSEALLKDLKPLVTALEADLYRRTEGADSDLGPEIRQQLEADYQAEFEAGRTAASWEAWLADQATQHAVAWLLSCVFVRFTEDNRLIDTPAIAGPLEDDRLELARHQHEKFIRTNPQLSEREYLLSVFKSLADLPVADEVFGPHNVLWRYEHWLSADAAGSLLAFFRKTNADTDGQITHDFADPDWDTRFLGDLYQDLSQATRKKYALLQTPDFVESFILDRTLEPALDAFGLEPTNPFYAEESKVFKMIDPACGSGHFLLGGFQRILTRWQDQRPDLAPVDQVDKALASIHGVDLNPYAVAIARFRLVLAAMRACGAATLKVAPNFHLNLAVGDSLLRGARGQHYIGSALGGIQMGLDPEDPATQLYASPMEDSRQLLEILSPGSYHAVVANPPYITVKDKAQNQNIRKRYGSCSGKYALSVPFMERIFELAICGEHGGNAIDSSGFTGQITSNSFMKREFGKKLIETFIPRWDVTHMVDTSGAYIPGYGTPTVILFGRNRTPVAGTLRAVQGIRGEPSTPDNPSEGFVWSAICDQIDRPGSESDFISVDDAEREKFHKHPWSIGGGGAAELKEQLDSSRESDLNTRSSSIGITSFTLEDDVYLVPPLAAQRSLLPSTSRRTMVTGDVIRDWCVGPSDDAVFPYDMDFNPITSDRESKPLKYLWLGRTCLSNNKMFGGKTKTECGLAWYEFGRLTADKLRTPLTITFAFVATHNHFVLDRGGKVFNRSAPVIKLPADATEDDYLSLLGLLNSSTACFWAQQTMHNKGGPGGGSSKDEKWHDFYEFSGTRLQTFPLRDERPHEYARQLDALSQQLAETTPARFFERSVPTTAGLSDAHKRYDEIVARMIALQEELDWQVYQIYGLIDVAPLATDPPSILPGQRAFEFILARQVAAGQSDTKWFDWLKIQPIIDLPGDWPTDYRKVVEQRIALIESNKDIALIERQDSKRRWELTPWDEQQEAALQDWLLSRLESLFDLDGRMNDANTITAAAELQQPALISTRRLAELAESDGDFMGVAGIFRGRDDFEIRPLVDELVAAGAVPFLPALRYKTSGLRKRAAWEDTWTRQRREDAVLSLFDQAKLASVDRDQADTAFDNEIAAVKTDLGSLTDEQADTLGKHLANAVRFVHDELDKTQRAAEMEAMNLEVPRQNRPMPTYAGGRIIDLDRRAFVCAEAVFGKIPVPPKYKRADFKAGWKHRGKLDVPKERWVSFPHCEGNDGSLVIAWAGYDHLQLATAIAGYFVHERDENGTVHLPLLTAIAELIPWLKQWHNEIDPEYGTRMGDYFEEYLKGAALEQDTTVEQLKNWQPPAATRGRRARNARQANDQTTETAAQD